MSIDFYDQNNNTLIQKLIDAKRTWIVDYKLFEEIRRLKKLFKCELLKQKLVQIMEGDTENQNFDNDSYPSDSDFESEMDRTIF